ncbi:G2/mitotic-specific cyclin-B [Nymphon striatum]|nr:G2/mitotic-specific cyclin-B [Nymphon striatum]
MINRTAMLSADKRDSKGLGRQENVLAAKNRKVATRSTRNRPALGDIGNKQPVASKNVTKPQIKKSKATSSLLPKKNVLPTPMEVEPAVEALASALSNQQLNQPQVQDIDYDDFDNPQLCSEYAKDIYMYLKQVERELNIKENFLENSKITDKMRRILIDWLVQVHLRFRLLQETLYLTVDIIDRHLQAQEVSKSKLQLVGVGAMFIASKYEEMYAPEIGDFVYITDNAFTTNEILKTEKQILHSINFALGKPLPLHFLRRYSKAGNADGMMHSLAKYLMELSLTEYDFSHYLPSELAAAALCLSMKILEQSEDSEWTDTLVHYSGYKLGDILPLLSKLADLVLNAEKSKYQAVRGKYSSSKFMKISCLPELKSAIVSMVAQGKH